MVENKITHYLSIAKNMCYCSDNARTRIGAVIVYRRYVLSVGWNCEDKTSPLQKEYNRLRGYDPDAPQQRNTIHAEMMAMLRARSLDVNWRKASLFVYRIKKDGTQGLAKPCNACEGFAKDLGIKNFYFSTDDDGGWCHLHLE